MIFVTGGAGFIGSNFILDWLAPPRRRRPRAGAEHRLPHLRRQPGQPGLGRAAPRLPLRATRHLRARIGARAHAPPSAARDRPLRCRVSHVDRSILGPAEFVRTNIEGTFSLLEAARAYWGELTGAGARGVPLPARVDRRGVRLPGTTAIRRSRKTTPISRTARTPRRRRPRTTSYARIITRTACPRSPRTARTTTVRISFPRSSSR
jgi:hypothetical protein